MLIVLPPSETKAPPPEWGRPVVLEELSFRELTPLREQVLGALIETSARTDAFERLQVRHSRAGDIARNTRLRELPTRPAFEVYTGPLHLGLDAATLSDAGAERAARQAVVISALWGAIRLHDRIRPIVSTCARAWPAWIGSSRRWRTVLPDLLADAAGPHSLIVDLRSQSYLATGTPRGAEARTVALRVDQGPRGHRIGDVIAKRVRGEAARHLLEADVDPPHPDALADVLAERWGVRLDAPGGKSRTWTMTLSIS